MACVASKVPYQRDGQRPVVTFTKSPGARGAAAIAIYDEALAAVHPREAAQAG